MTRVWSCSPLAQDLSQKEKLLLTSLAEERQAVPR